MRETGVSSAENKNEGNEITDIQKDKTEGDNLLI